MTTGLPLYLWFFPLLKNWQFLAFSDNLFAENSNFSVVSGNQRNQLLECMCTYNPLSSLIFHFLHKYPNNKLYIHCSTKSARYIFFNFVTVLLIFFFAFSWALLLPKFCAVSSFFYVVIIFWFLIYFYIDCMIFSQLPQAPLLLNNTWQMANNLQYPNLNINW